jgi:exopolyphosphatase/pppGpp-phosphohydrolase
MRYGPSRGCSPNCNTVRVIAAAIDVGTNTTHLLVARVQSAHLTPLATDEVITALDELEVSTAGLREGLALAAIR